MAGGQSGMFSEHFARINPFSAGIDDPRTEITETCIMVVDPLHRYSNEAERVK